MSQYDFGTIDPTAKSGTALATDLNSWRTALHSMHSGTSRPSYAVAGTMWLDTTGSPNVVKIFDGTDDITFGNLDTGANTFTITLAANSVTATEIAADTITASEIATGAVTTDEILNGTIALGDLAFTPMVASTSTRVTANMGFTPQTDSSSSGTLALDFATGNITRVTLTENVTTVTFANAVAGDVLEVWITQDSTARTVAGWPAAVKWIGGGTAPTISTTSGAIDVITLRYDGTNYIGSFAQDAQ